MRKTIITFSILFFLLSINIFINSEENIFSIKQNDYIYLNVFFSSKIRINNKILLLDPSNDILKYVKGKETTDDLINSGNFIYKLDDIDRIKHFELILSDNIKQKLNIKILNKKINIHLNSYLDDVTEDAYIIAVEILNYNEGEYNFIKNIPTSIYFNSSFYRKTNNNNIMIITSRKYTRKADIDFPTEKLRLEYISNKIADNLIKFINKRYVKIKLKNNEINDNSDDNKSN